MTEPRTSPWTDTAFLLSDHAAVFFDDPRRIAARTAYDEALQRWYAYADAHPGERNEWGGPPADWNVYLDAYGENLERIEQAVYEDVRRAIDEED